MNFDMIRLVGRMGWATAPLAAAALLAGCGPDCKEKDMIDVYLDADGDGVGSGVVFTGACAADAGWSTGTGDCDDTNAAALPGGAEVCDGVDNDCDGVVDPAGSTGELTFYADTDGDLFGDSTVTVTGCAPPTGYVANDDDCDDADAAINPAADDVCDDVDNDCNGTPDDGPETLQYADSDGDGYGTPRYTVRSCEPVEGYVFNDEDCDDLDEASNPDGVEVCDGHDNDCDGETDPGSAVDAPSWHVDTDGDGYGDAGSLGEVRCDGAETEAPNADDCDDTSAAARPGGVEDCDGLDNDCDGKIDWGLSVPTNFAKVKDAVDAAADGDVICFDDGIVEGPIDTAGKSLTLRGRGSAVTTFDAKGRGQAIAVQNGETVTIEGMTISGGKSARGAALFVENSEVILNDVVVSDNDIFAAPTSATATSAYGYGLVYITSSKATMTDVTFTANDVTPDLDIASTWTATTLYGLYTYGALVAFESSLVTWEGGEITGNSVVPDITKATGSYVYTYLYGGLIYESNSFVKIKDVPIYDNTVDVDQYTTAPTAASYSYGYLYGSLIAMSGGLMTLDGVDVTDNDVTMTGGYGTTSAGTTYYSYYYHYGSIYGTATTLNWRDSAFSTNTFEGDSTYNLYMYGATFYMTSSTLSAKALEIDSNTASVTTTYSSYNTPSAYVYGSYFSSTVLTWDDVTFTNNDFSTASPYYSTIYGFYLSNSSTAWTDVAVEDNAFTAAVSGTYNYAYAYMYGFYATSQPQTWDNVSVTNNTFTNDSATSYSGGYTYNYVYGWYFSSAATTWSDVTLQGNTFEGTGTASSGYGYAYAYPMYMSSAPGAWTDVLIDGNTFDAELVGSTSASYSSSAYNYGAMYATSSAQTWSGVDITDNTYGAKSNTLSTSVYNYGLYASSSALTWTDVTIDGNDFTASGTTSAYQYGLYESSAALTLNQVALTDNTFTTVGTTSYLYPLVYVSSGTAHALTNTILAGNTLTAGSLGYYGMIYNANSTMTFTNDVIANNTTTAKYLGASQSGNSNYYGVLYSGSLGHYTLLNTSVDNNTFSASGASGTPTTGVFYNANTSSSSSRGTWTTSYSNLYGNSGTYIYYYSGGTSGSTPVGSSGVIAKDPEYTSASTRDYTLASTSDLIDAGSTSVYDADGTTSDIGAYGGPGGDW